MSLSFSSVFEMTYPRGVCFEDFSSATRELIFFKSGRGSTNINGIEYQCRKNSICLTRPGDRRNQICQEPTGYICIRFTGYESDGESLPDEPCSGVFDGSDPLFRSLFLDVMGEWKRMEPRFHRICNLKIAELLTRITRLGIVGRGEAGFYGLIKEIEGHRLFNLSVEEMARRVNLSPDHFRHKFKGITGSSPTEYLINRRIDYALELLALGRYNCSQISELCGFSTPGQFSLIFKRKTGLSPSAFRGSVI